MKKIPLMLSTGLVALSALPGCTNTRQAALSGIAATSASADRNLSVRQNLEAYRGPANVRVRNGIWLGEEGVKTNAGEPLPDIRVSINSQRALSLDQIASRLSSETNIRHSVESISVFQTSAAGASRTPAGANADPFDTANLPGPLAGVSTSPMSVNFQGSLRDFLKAVSNHFDIEWEYRNGVVRFLGVQTRQFTLQSIATETNINANVQGTISSSGGASAGGVNRATQGNSTAQAGTTSRMQINYWGLVENTIKVMVPEGTPFAINKDSGTITVTARPSVLKIVENYVRGENQRLGRQVAIDVKIMSVTTSDSDNYNLNLSILFQDVASGINLGFQAATPVGQVANAALGSAGIIAGTKQGRTLGYFRGSEAFIRALSERANARVVTSASVTTTNNAPAPISVLRENAYLARRSQTSIEGSRSPTVSLEPGTISTGFTMNVTPRIFSTGEMVLQYNIVLSELIQIKDIGDTASGNFIQAPEVDSRSLIQSVRIKSGDTLVLGGFERVRSAAQNSGVGNPGFWGLGGGVVNENRREVLIIMITPTVLESNSQLQAEER